MLDLYADWCVACRELDEKTFRDPIIQQSLRHYHLLRADVSANSREHQALMQELQVLGLPNVLFFDAQSQPNPQLRLQGLFPPMIYKGSWISVSTTSIVKRLVGVFDPR